MATTVLGLKTFTASDPVDYNEINDNYNKIDNGVKTAFQGSAAKNWLDNSDMTNVINQRGASSYTGQVYGIDRWRGRAVAQTVSVRSADVTVTATGTSYAGIKQKVHGMPRLAGKTVTFAARLYANVVPELVLFDSSEQSLAVKIGTAGATQTLILTYAIPTDATADSVVPTILLKTSASGDYMRIYWAALYEGSYTADTLPAYQPKGYAAELAECQRYYYQSWDGASFSNKGWITKEAISASSLALTEFPTEMRIVPTITFYTAANETGVVKEWTTNSSVSATQNYTSTKAFGVNGGGNFTIGKTYYFHYSASADL